MGRKRIDLGADASDRIRALLTRGATAEEVAATLRVSVTTAKRRIRELKGKTSAVPSAPRVVKKPPPGPSPNAGAEDGDGESDSEAEDGDELPDGEQAIPSGTSLEKIDYWLGVAERKAREAEKKGNADLLVKMARLAAVFVEAKRKATPIPKDDPNEHPDMVEAAAKVRKRMHELADSLVRVANSPLADTIGRLVRGSAS
jgi:hypothetical protein